MTESFTAGSIIAQTTTVQNITLAAGAPAGNGVVLGNNSGLSMTDGSDTLIIAPLATTARSLTLPNSSGLITTLNSIATYTNKTIPALDNSVTTNVIAGVTISGTASNLAVLLGTSATTAVWTIRQVIFNLSSGVTQPVRGSFTRVANYSFVHPGTTQIASFLNVRITFNVVGTAVFRIRDVTNADTLLTTPSQSGINAPNFGPFTLPANPAIIELQATFTTAGSVVSNVLFYAF